MTAFSWESETFGQQDNVHESATGSWVDSASKVDGGHG